MKERIVIENTEQKIRLERKIKEKKDYIEALEKEKEYIASGLAEFHIQEKTNKAENRRLGGSIRTARLLPLSCFAQWFPSKQDIHDCTQNVQR